jgi:hypothetical protein
MIRRSTIQPFMPLSLSSRLFSTSGRPQGEIHLHGAIVQVERPLSGVEFLIACHGASRLPTEIAG